MAAVKNELKKKKTFLSPEILQKLEMVLENRWYDVEVVTTKDWAEYHLRLDFDSYIEEEGSTTFYRDEGIEEYVYGDVIEGRKQAVAYWYNGYEDEENYSVAEYPEFDPNKPFVVIVRQKSYTWHKNFGEYGRKFHHTILIYAPHAA